jgi:small GTP-binding protein
VSRKNATEPLSLAIVGHTNTGKTSLIRTLLRSETFGSVKNAAGTTRHVESAMLMAEQTAIIEMFDTPGLEDSTALLEALQSMQSMQPNTTVRALDRLKTLLHNASTYTEFDQEIKVVRQAVNCDVLLYIVDVREPVLGKYHDEISILSMAERPIIPVFNFTASHPENLKHWRTAMAQFNLHSVVEFDTVAFDFEAEKRLYQKLQSVIEARYEHIQQLIDFRKQRWLSLQQAACQQVSELLVNIASFRQAIAKTDNTEQIIAKIQNHVRQSEQQCLKTILTLFEFSADDLEHHPIPVTNGKWNSDLFAADTLKEFGLDCGSAAAKGAVVGAGIDLMVAGLSLGTASLIGAVIGATWSTAKRYSGELMAKVKGEQWFCVDDQTVTLVLLRQLQLLRTLLHRGHAAQNKISLNDKNDRETPPQWQEHLKVMRSHPNWSNLQHSKDPDDQHRLRFVAAQSDWVLSTFYQ